ncbi:GcrA family cell cycle regulator [Rhodoblastus sp.]|uniref:GcrA family cell cycle regulator n=1 Tax=Rhodoblastus sp. TaxID=1962975 RepID=UPI00262702A2|nr:GcrA family cell cycle regulator [Rhodoblastus sp.]
MSWTDERVEQLKKMWLDGLSASQIASELAHGITRNAVIGKVHRLGLSGRVKSPAPAPVRARVKPRAEDEKGAPTAPISHGNLAVALEARPAPAPAPRPAAKDVVIPMSERVSIMELRESMCRWPLGDPASPDFRYCGAKMQIGLGPYCAHHARIAYQPAQDRRRDREKRAARG